MDPSEWKKECDKVGSLLVIPECAEYMYNSQSEENLKSFINFDDINSDHYNRGKTLNMLTQYFQKTTISKDISRCEGLSTYLDNQISLVDKYENKISKSLGLKVFI